MTWLRDGYTDRATSKELALAEFQKGAKYMFAFSAAGNFGIFEAAKDKGFFTSGVDTDQRSVDPAHIVESVVKRTDVGVHEASRTWQRHVLRRYRAYGLGENGVGPASLSPGLQPAARLPQDVQDKVRALAAKIVRPDRGDRLPRAAAAGASAKPACRRSRGVDGRRVRGPRSARRPRFVRARNPTAVRGPSRRRGARRLVRGIVERYGSLAAVARVDLACARGEVHAVVGENGAGKTTLMQILAGVVPDAAGSSAAHDAGARRRGGPPLGIAMVHQHFMLLPSLTVAENLTLGREPRRGLASSMRRGGTAVVELGDSTRCGSTLEAHRRAVGRGDLQRVEILRALFRDAELLILDEPTGVLTPQEAEGLFGVIRELAGGGKATVFISHKLEEVLQISRSASRCCATAA